MLIASMGLEMSLSHSGSVTMQGMRSNSTTKELVPCGRFRHVRRTASRKASMCRTSGTDHCASRLMVKKLVPPGTHRNGGTAHRSSALRRRLD